MRLILERIHRYLTGTDIPDDVKGVEFGVPGTGLLSGVRVIVGRDRIRQSIPPQYYPFVILENGTERGAPGMRQPGTCGVQLFVAVLVRGGNGALVGESGILALVENLKTVLGLGTEDTEDRRSRERLSYQGKNAALGVSSYNFDPDMETGENGLVGLQLGTLAIQYQTI